MTKTEWALEGLAAFFIVLLLLVGLASCGGEFDHNPACYDTSTWTKKEGEDEPNFPCDDATPMTTATNGEGQ